MNKVGQAALATALVAGSGYAGAKVGEPPASNRYVTNDGVTSNEIPEVAATAIGVGFLGTLVGFMGATLPHMNKFGTKPPWALGMGLGAAAGAAFGTGLGISVAEAFTSVPGAQPMPAVDHLTLKTAREDAADLSEGSQPAVVITERGGNWPAFNVNTILDYDPANKFDGQVGSSELKKLVSKDPEARYIIDGDTTIEIRAPKDPDLTEEYHAGYEV